MSGSPYPITPSAAVGSGVGNYTITYVAGNLTVNPAPLTITASSQSKTYGAAPSLGTTAFSTSTLYNGDTVTGVTLASSGAAATATVSSSPYAITPSTATGTGLSNYSITYVNGNLTVNTASLTVTASAQSKTYGSTPSLGTTAFTTTGTLYNGDTVTGVTLTSSGTASTATVSGSPYAIAPGAATGTGLNNYSITYVNGNLTVNPKSLTISPNNVSNVYGAALPTFTFTPSGFVNGDTMASLTTQPTATTTATAASPVGTYVITASGAVDPNYTIGYGTGTLTVTMASVAAWDDAKCRQSAGSPGLRFQRQLVRGQLQQRLRNQDFSFRVQHQPAGS